MYNTKTLRGTIFCPPIKYNKEFVSKLNFLFKDYIPVLYRDGVLPMMPSWQLSSPDEKEVILFNGDKIDLVLSINDRIDDTVVQQFSNRCIDVFRLIMEITGLPCSRMALAPSIVVTENGIRPDSLYNRLFGLQEFMNTRPGISNVSQVFCVTLNIGNKDIKVNHVANFHVENEVINIKGQNSVKVRYICDFDINTMVNPEYRFNIEDLISFYSTIPSCFKNYYNLYLAE